MSEHSGAFRTPSDGVVNVCFHGLGEPARELDPGEAEYWVGRDQFLRILDEVATWPSVRLSFDDGNDSDIRIGLPALTERRLTADFFVLAGRLGTAGSLQKQDLAELVGHGMRIGSHGMGHRSWRGMTAQVARDELVDARDRLADVSNTPVSSVACPLGLYDRRVLADLRRLGYVEVFTSDRRVARRGHWLQPRFSVRRDDTPASLREQVAASERWTARTRATVVGAAKRWRPGGVR